MSRTAANPNRWYYACARGREDPQRCKFFKWEDELGGANASPAKGQTLGGAPGTPSRLMRPTPGSATPKKTPAATTPSKSAATPSRLLQATLTSAAGVESPSAKRLRRWNDPKDAAKDGSDEGELDWGSIDTDKLEEEARSVTSTPRAVRFDTTASATKKRKLDESDSVS